MERFHHGVVPANATRAREGAIVSGYRVLRLRPRRKKEPRKNGKAVAFGAHDPQSGCDVGCEPGKNGENHPRDSFGTPGAEIPNTTRGEEKHETWDICFVGIVQIVSSCPVLNPNDGIHQPGEKKEFNTITSYHTCTGYSRTPPQKQRPEPNPGIIPDIRQLATVWFLCLHP